MAALRRRHVPCKCSHNSKHFQIPCVCVSTHLLSSLPFTSAMMSSLSGPADRKRWPSGSHAADVTVSRWKLHTAQHSTWQCGVGRMCARQLEHLACTYYGIVYQRQLHLKARLSNFMDRCWWPTAGAASLAGALDISTPAPPEGVFECACCRVPEPQLAVFTA
jgi:hypothetical protein